MFNLFEMAPAHLYAVLVTTSPFKLQLLQVKEFLDSFLPIKRIVLILVMTTAVLSGNDTITFCNRTLD